MKNIALCLCVVLIAAFTLVEVHRRSDGLSRDVQQLSGFSYLVKREQHARKADRQGENPVKIGVVGPWAKLKGDDDLLQGIQLACTEQNAAGGILGRPVELVICDDEGGLEQGKAAVQELCEDPDVIAVIGGVYYHSFISQAPLCEFNGMLLVSPTVTAGLFAEQRKYSYAFINFPDAKTITESIAVFLEQRKLRRINVISPTEYYYGYYFCNALSRYLAKDTHPGEGIMARDVYFEPLQQAYVRRLFYLWEDTMDYDVLLLGCDNLEALRMVVRAAAEQKHETPILVSDMLESRILMNDPELIQGNVYLPSVFDVYAEKDAVTGFVQRYQAQYGQPPDTAAAQGYDTLNVLCAAIQEGQSSVPARIAATLRSMEYTNNVSIADRIAFNEKGELSSGMSAVKVCTNGSFLVVHPETEVAPGK